MSVDYWVDSHCHLNYKGLNDRTESVLKNAESRGVGCFLTINTKLREYDQIVDLIDAHDRVYGSVGVHPHEAEEEQGITADMLIKRAQHNKIVAIGETGLDYYYDNAPRDLQKQNFLAHIEAARQTGLPLIIHTRDADDDCLSILRETKKEGDYKALIHCFTASEAFGRAVLDLGLYISISGIVTFKNAKDLKAFAKTVPDDRLLVETDSPFLAPVPNRGKVCEPAFVVDTAHYLASLRGVKTETLCSQTTENFFRFFSKATPPEVLPNAA